MAKLTEAMHQDAVEALPQLDAIMALAAANFPAQTKVRVETCGSNPHGSITVPYYVISAILDAARAALKE